MKLHFIILGWSLSAGSMAPDPLEEPSSGGESDGRSTTDTMLDSGSPQANCDHNENDPMPTTGTGELQTVPATVVTYALRWSWEGAEPNGSGGMSFETSAGDRFDISTLSLATQSAELLACPSSATGDKHSTHRPRLGLPESLTLRSSVGGHSYDTGPTYVEGPVIEEGLNSMGTILGEVNAGEQTYHCELHILHQIVPGQPGDLLEYQTMHWRGRYAPAGTHRWQDLDLVTPLPMAARLDLEVNVPPQAPHVDIIIERSVVRAAEDIDWSLDGVDLPYEVLRGLVASTMVRATPPRTLPNEWFGHDPLTPLKPQLRGLMPVLLGFLGLRKP